MASNIFSGNLDIDLSQFDFKNIPDWRGLPKIVLFVVLIAALTGAWYWQLFAPQIEALEAAKATEQDLKAQLQAKFAKAATLPLLREQSIEARERLQKLDALLPPSEEMPKILSQVNRIGYEHDLRFELFQPEAPIQGENFGAVPVRVQMKGKFQDLSRFIGTIAMQPRLMMFDEMRLTFQPGSDMLLDAKLLAFRQPGGPS
ncbi:MAG: type 4a pilus biogenesis protein PilO [Burkholderiaceae bacterium]|jgi:type IV pilus assembly protein PilO